LKGPSMYSSSPPKLAKYLLQWYQHRAAALVSLP
jgi:hypothetical protein